MLRQNSRPQTHDWICCDIAAIAAAATATDCACTVQCRKGLRALTIQQWTRVTASDAGSESKQKNWKYFISNEFCYLCTVPRKQLQTDGRHLEYIGLGLAAA